jgi:hypothetical protein
MINYLDRAVLGVAAPSMTEELKISPEMMGLIFSAFSWTYALAQIPGGIVLDRLGTRITYGASLVLWSVATFLQGLSANVTMLFGFRLALGVAEAPCYPCNSRVLSTWFPQDERARANSVSFDVVDPVQHGRADGGPGDRARDARLRVRLVLLRRGHVQPVVAGRQVAVEEPAVRAALAHEVDRLAEGVRPGQVHLGPVVHLVGHVQHAVLVQVQEHQPAERAEDLRLDVDLRSGDVQLAGPGERVGDDRPVDLAVVKRERRGRGSCR